MLAASSNPLFSAFRYMKSRKDLEERNYSFEMLSLLDINLNVDEYFEENQK